MKTNFTNCMALVLFAVFVIACSKNKSDIKTPEGIEGSWRWTATNGGIANNIHDTPASTGTNVDLQLNSDRSFSVTKNGIIDKQGSFTLINRICIHDNKPKKVIDFLSDDMPDMMIENMDATTLELSDENNDGISSNYARIVK